MIALWRNHTRRGSDEAQKIIYSFESELTRRNIFASVKINDFFSNQIEWNIDSQETKFPDSMNRL